MGYAYVRKTEDEFDIEGNYGQGFEMVTCETTRKMARERIREYRDSEPGIPFKIVKHRVKKVLCNSLPTPALSLSAS
jgi:DNA polymerase IIIc chi subunit